MSENHSLPYAYPVAYPTAYPYAQAPVYTPLAPDSASLSCETLTNMAMVGAIVGGSAAAAHNARRMKHEGMELGEALVATGRTAIASATATVVAGATANAVAKEGMLRLSLMFGVSAALLYGIHQWSEGKQEKG